MKQRKLKIVLMPKFLRSLEKIYEYIFFELCAPNAADRIYEKIFKELKRLEDSPLIHMKIENTNDFKLYYRKIIVKNYIVLYTINEDKNEVYVTHIFYSKSNYRTKL